MKEFKNGLGYAYLLNHLDNIVSNTDENILILLTPKNSGESPVEAYTVNVPWGKKGKHFKSYLPPLNYFVANNELYVKQHNTLFNVGIIQVSNVDLDFALESSAKDLITTYKYQPIKIDEAILDVTEGFEGKTSSKHLLIHLHKTMFLQIDFNIKGISPYPTLEINLMFLDEHAKSINYLHNITPAISQNKELLSLVEPYISKSKLTHEDFENLFGNLEKITNNSDNYLVEYSDKISFEDVSEFLEERNIPLFSELPKHIFADILDSARHLNRNPQEFNEAIILSISNYKDIPVQRLKNSSRTELLIDDVKQYVLSEFLKSDNIT